MTGPDDDEDDDMPRCACCLDVMSPDELNEGGLCDFCCDYEHAP